MQPDNFMVWFPKIFKFLGLWPPEKNKQKQVLYYIIYLPIFAFFTLYLNVSEMIECYQNRNDFKQTLLNLGIIFLHAIATMRIIHWHCVQNECKNLHQKLLTNNFTFVRLHSGQNIFKSFKSHTTKQRISNNNETIEQLEDFRRKTIKFANKQSCSLYFGVAFLMFCDILVSYVSVRVINAWEMKQNANNATAVRKILPYNTYFFFDAQCYYDIAWLYQFFSILFTMYQMGRKYIEKANKKHT